MGNWKEIEISKLLEKTKTENPKINPDSEFIYIDISSIDREIKKIVEPKLLKGSEAPSRARKSVLNGDVLFATTRPNLQNIAIVEDNAKKQIASTGFCVLRVNKELVENGYLFNYLLTNEVQELIAPLIRGAQYPAISDKDLKSIKIPVPPLPEQKRIVTKLNGLFAKIDTAIGLLEENIIHTKALMGSVLDEEFGKLDCKSNLLKNISDKIQYGYTGKTKETGKYYYLRITDIQDSKVNFSKAPFSTIPDEEAKKYILNQGDILFARTGATAGKSYLFKDKEPSIFASYLIRVVVKQDKLSHDYLKWYFQSDEYWNQIFGNIVGAAQPNFNGKKLGELNIPVPSLDVQNKCVSKFEKYDKVIRSSIETQTQKLTHLKALKSSLLDQAFKGEL